MKSGRKSMSAKTLKSLKGMDTNCLLVCVLVIALIAVGLYYLIRENSNKNNKNNKNVLENFESQPAMLNNITEKPNPKHNELVIVLFYVDWCPHCVSTKPEWEKLVNNMNNTEVNGNKVVVSACNAEGSELEQNFAKENNVQGFPTIKVIKENDVVEYNGARNAEALEEFVRENAN
tara:strand:- start:14 stop:541 length:528 start_codon:yes stop_codon:yes gene_type:complete